MPIKREDLCNIFKAGFEGGVWEELGRNEVKTDEE